MERNKPLSGQNIAHPYRAIAAAKTRAITIDKECGRPVGGDVKGYVGQGNVEANVTLDPYCSGGVVLAQKGPEVPEIYRGAAAEVPLQAFKPFQFQRLVYQVGGADVHPAVTGKPTGAGIGLKGVGVVDEMLVRNRQRVTQSGPNCGAVLLCMNSWRENH